MRALALAALLLGALAGRAPAQSPIAADDDHTREAPAFEGPLDNDVYVPIVEAASEALSSGDQALVRARAAQVAGPASEAARLLDVAFDHWREALVRGGAGASTWFDPRPEAERRLSEGLHAGVLRRLAGLSSGERARWTARLAAGAESALAGLHDGRVPGDGLGELVRLFPGTSAAARAALELGDLALEAGLVARARGWYACAQREAELSGDGSVPAAAQRRTGPSGPASKAATEAWHAATACDFLGSLTWNDPGRHAPGPERRAGPGGAFVDDQRFVLQTAGELILLDLPAAGGIELAARVRLADLLGSETPETDFDVPREPPGWPLLPLADADGVALVVGRTQRAEPNALVALELDEPSLHTGLGLELTRVQPAAQLLWAIIGTERFTAGQSELVPELEELGEFEFQPGPVASADRIVVQARQFDGQVRAWVLAFERRDGALAWKRQIASGKDRIPTQRFAETEKRIAAQPLLAMEAGGPRVFVGTHLGLGGLLDGLLGEPLWSFKNRRRGEHENGWSGDRPPVGTGADSHTVLWAPMDSDRLYALRPGPLQAGAGEAESVLARPPAPLVDAQSLLGGDAEEYLVLGNMGAERCVSARRSGRDRVDALHLAPDERFHGRGLVSPERAWVSTNRGLYLLDRTRELYLLDYQAFPPLGSDAPGGDLHARGARLLVLGSGALWSFRAR